MAKNIKKHKKRILEVFGVIVGIILIVSAIMYVKDKYIPEKIADEIVSEFINTGYRVFEYYPENLDTDKDLEVILLLEEDPFFGNNRVKESEGLRSTPALVKVLNFTGTQWDSTLSLKADGGDFPAQFFYKPVFAKNNPYKIYNINNEKILAIFSVNRSFDGESFTVSLFRYHDEKGLVRVLTDDNWSTEGLVESEDGIFFGVCNPFTEDKYMTVQKLNLQSGFRTDTAVEEAGIICDEYIELTSDKYTDWGGVTPEVTEIFKNELIKNGFLD